MFLNFIKNPTLLYYFGENAVYLQPITFAKVAVICHVFGLNPIFKTVSTAYGNSCAP